MNCFIWSNYRNMLAVMVINVRLLRFFELWFVGGGKLLTMCYFGLGWRQHADRIIFPMRGMSVSLGEFLSPGLVIDPSTHKSLGPHVRHGRTPGWSSQLNGGVEREVLVLLFECLCVTRLYVAFGNWGAPCCSI